MITGTLISYYFICKRKCWLSYHKIGLEDNSEDVRIGKILHELKETKDSEISIDGIKIDRITSKFLVEYKKSDSNELSAIMQTLLYLYILDRKGISLKGRIEFLEGPSKKSMIIELTDENKKKVENAISEIELFLNEPSPPKIEDKKKCKRCAYYDYCLL